MPVYLSASSISDFLKCSQRVFYRIYKTVPEMPTKEMITGKIVHAAIERGWKDKGVAYSVINEMADENGLRKADITDMQFLIDIFFLNFRGMLKDNDSVEYKFKIPLYDDVFIVGKMDRISNGNIFDWKSGGRIPKSLSNDVQCIIYDFAYTRIFSKKPVSICLASLAEGKLYPYIPNDMYKKELFTNIIPRMIKTIRNDSFERLGMFTHGCFKCSYKQGCLGELNVVDSPESS